MSLVDSLESAATEQKVELASEALPHMDDGAFRKESRVAHKDKLLCKAYD